MNAMGAIFLLGGVNDENDLWWNNAILIDRMLNRLKRVHKREINQYAKN